MIVAKHSMASCEAALEEEVDFAVNDVNADR